MSSTADISVALCTFRGEKFLGQQLRSIAEQTAPPSEIVVCDDRSDDATMLLVERFAQTVTYPVRVVVNDRQLGCAKNFEKAISLCRGTFIALSDQDDIWKPRKLEVLSTALAADSLNGYAFCRSQFVTPQGVLTGKDMWHGTIHEKVLRRGFPPDEQLGALLRANITPGAAMMFRASLRPVLLPIAQQWMHDYWIVLIATLAGYRGVAVEEPLHGYRLHPQQVLGGPVHGVTRLRHALQSKDCSAEVRRFELLRDRANAFGSKDIAAVDAKIAHLRNRMAGISARGVKKLRAVISELARGGYADFSNSWRTAIRDLL